MSWGSLQVHITKHANFGIDQRWQILFPAISSEFFFDSQI